MTIDPELLASVIKDLKAWFPPEVHKERDLKGGGKWFFVPWQAIRDRLDEVVPNWECSYSSPQYLDKYCVVTCSITILGITRQAIGNAEIELLSNAGKDMSRGTPIERAIADAFKNAAEAWGIARYLDEQTDPKTKAAFIKHMQHGGDGRAAAWHHQNQGNTPTRPRNDPPARPFGQPTTTPKKPAPAAPSVVPAHSEVRMVAPGLADTFNVRLKAAKDAAGLVELKGWLRSPQVLDQLQDTVVLQELESRLRRKAEEVFQGVDLTDVNAEIGLHMERIGWTSLQGRSHLEQTYGKRSRQELTELELFEFCEFLKGQQQLALQGV